MKITKLALIALLGGALMAIGCGDDETNGTGGIGGNGGGGSGGTIDPLCEPTPTFCDEASGDLEGDPCTTDADCGDGSCVPRTCEDGTINEHTPCCTQTVPDLADACTGSESTESPPACEATGTVVVHTLRLMVTADSCNTGFDLDSCDGTSCVPGGLAPFEGINGVDNGLTGLAPTLDGVGGNLDGVNQAFSDALCGLTDDPEAGVCEDDSPCTADADCEGIGMGECNLGDDDCSLEIPPLTITLGVDANIPGNCANVEIKSVGACDAGSTDPGAACTEPCTNDPAAGFCDADSSNEGEACTADGDCTDGTCDLSAGGACLGGGTSTAIVALSDPTTAGTVCASGTLGNIPISIAGVPGVFGNVVVRATVDQTQGFTGLLGSTVDEATAVTIAELLLEGAGAVVTQVLDISDNLTQDTSAACNALSTALVVGGTVPAP